MKTFTPSAAAIERKWYVVDATDMTLGRLSSEVTRFCGESISPFLPPIWIQAIM